MSRALTRSGRRSQALGRRWKPGRVLTIMWLGAILISRWVLSWSKRPEGEGLREVVRNYLPDNLMPVSEEDGQLIRRSSGCIACGLCDAVGVRPAGAERTGPDGPSYMAAFVSRSLPELWTAEDYLEKAVLADRLALSTQVCPMGVPLIEQAEFLRRSQRRLVEMREELAREESEERP